MTLIIGAKCYNGVTIIADTKITGIEGTFLGHEKKLFGELQNVIFGCAGSIDMISLFRRCVVGEVIMLRDSPNAYTDENLIDKLRETMILFKHARFGQYFQLTIMVARLLPHIRTSDINTVDSEGRINYEFNCPWKAIGSGAGKVDPILRKEWNDLMTMRDFAKLGYSTIKYIEYKEPQGSVGVGDGEPSIIYLPNGETKDTEPLEGDMIEFKQSFPNYITSFDNIYHSI